MPHISIRTLQLKVLDIITNCLSNWSNPELNITIELQKTGHASMVFIHMKHKSSSTCFFKSAIRISTHRLQNLLKLKQFLNFIEKVLENLEEIESMQLIVQVIMVILCILVAFIVLYYCCWKFRHMCTLFKYCFLFLPISRILRTSPRTDSFVEVTNVTKGNTVWAHFMATGYFPTNIHLSRPISKESVQIETHCCIFKRLIIDRTNTEVTGISGIRIEMPNEANVI